MNAKSKVFGLLAAIGLTMSMFAGVAAQSSDSEWTSASLSDPYGAICTVDIIGVSGSFGTWEFDGSGYAPTSSTQMSFITNVYGGGASGCFVNVYFDGLYGPGGWIDPGFFTAYSDFRFDFVDPWGFGDLLPTGLNEPNVSYYDFDYTLQSVPSYMTPGVYEGGMNVWVSNAA